MDEHKKLFAREQQRDRRLCVLLFLAETSGGTANSYVLQRVLSRFGHAVSHDLTRTELAWLHEQGLVQAEILPAITAAVITRAGRDVAAGLSTVPGVAVPSEL